MKRIMILLSALVLLLGAVPALAESTETVASYDFDFTFHLEPSVFPEESRERIAGYADLLGMLELKGRWTWCREYKTLDTEFSVIPVTRPEAALNFHLYGFTSHLLLSSPLLGNQTILFNNEALMEFCMKSYEHLGLPLPYLALLYPYTPYNAFYYCVKAWEAAAGTPGTSRTVPFAEMQNVAAEWSRLLEEDPNLTDWFTAMSLESDHQESLMAEVQNAPTYWTETVLQGNDLQIACQADMETWTAGDRIILDQVKAEDLQSLRLNLPATESGYLPVLQWARQKTDEGTAESLLMSYAPDPAQGEDLGAENLLTLQANASWPSVWPSDFTGESVLSLTGVLLPEMHFRSRLTSQASGEFALDIIPEGAAMPALTIWGTLTPRTGDEAPWYRLEQLVEYLNVFSMNDATLADFVHQVARPAVKGLISFLVEVPASACRSLMDDLTDYGVLSVILGD